MTGDSNTFVQLTDVLLPEARKGHKLTVINFGPTINIVHTMHPDTIKPVLGPGIIVNNMHPDTIKLALGPGIIVNIILCIQILLNQHWAQV